MFMKRLIFFVTVSFSLMLMVSCSGGLPAGASSDLSSSGSSSGASDIHVRDSIFSDSAVTSFLQVGGVVINRPSLIGKLFSSAYAISGNIRCVEDAPVAFELDALGNTVQVDTNCNSNMDLNIRRKLLESMAGKRILMEYGGGHDTRSEGRVITFNNIGSFWGTYDNIVSGAQNTGHNEHLCKDKMTFDQATGQVTIEHDVTNSLIAGTDTTQDCLNSEFVGATEVDYKKILNYRFKDGKLEFDEGVDFTINNDYNRFCIDNNVDGLCD
jgi:hypothetical protein